MRRRILCLLLVWTSFSVANGQETQTVAQDGNEDFTTIQAAISAAPVGEKTTIHINEGVYAEQVVIGSKTAPSGKIISLIGDGIDKTIITSKAGLDTSHVGIAVWQDGKLHLMHASSLKKKVILDSKTFYDYSQGQPSHLGIRLYRLK